MYARIKLINRGHEYGDGVYKLFLFKKRRDHCLAGLGKRKKEKWENEVISWGKRMQ